MQLDNELIIETPEHIELRFALANVGNRFLASLIDHLLQFFGLLFIGIFLFLIRNTLNELIGEQGEKWIIALLMLIGGGLVLFIVGYFTIFETFWNGQTPGKRWMKLRVIKDDGRPIGIFEATVRNALRLIDFFPSGYAIGVVSIILSDESRRLGDYVAGTVVVKERSSEAPSLNEILTHHDFEISQQSHSSQTIPYLDVRKLNEDELIAIETFLIRRKELSKKQRPKFAEYIAAALSYKLKIDNITNSEEFIEEVDRQYRAQAKYLID